MSASSLQDAGGSISDDTCGCKLILQGFCWEAQRSENSLGPVSHCAEALSVLQLMEDLEQLKVLENGYKIKVIVVDHKAHGVDEPEDVAVLEQKMREQGLT